MSKEQLSVMRARIEAELGRPSALVVTSAKPKDGKTLVATSLASNLAKAGHRVLMVDAGDGAQGEHVVSSAPKLSALREFDILSYVTPGAPMEADVLGLWGGGVLDSATVENVRVTFAQLRERYDYVIVDTSPAQKNALALSLAAVAEATLISIRVGRSSSSADRELIESLRSTGAKVIGVVMTDAKALAAFNATRHAEARSLRRRSIDEARKTNTSVSVSL